MPRIKLNDFLSNTKDIMAKRVGMRCSLCDSLTIGPGHEKNKAVNFGVACHITAAATGGPRYDQTLSFEERRDIDNGIWLCSRCSTIIDNSANLTYYTVDMLRECKQSAEEKTRLESKICTSNAIQDDHPENKDFLTLFEHSNKCVDNNFLGLTGYDSAFIADIKLKECQNIIDMWDVSGYERARDLAIKIEDMNLPWNKRSAYLDLIGTLRIKSLQRFLVTYIFKTHHEIKGVGHINTIRLESAFYNLSEIGDITSLPQIISIAKIILRPHVTALFPGKNSISYLAYAIVNAICKIHWRAGQNETFQKELSCWLYMLPVNLMSELLVVAKKNLNNHKFSIKTNNALQDRDYLEWFAEYLNQIVHAMEYTSGVSDKQSVHLVKSRIRGTNT